FHQRRTIEYAPGRLLTVQDKLSSSTQRSFVSSLHISHHLIPTMSNQGLDVELSGGKLIRATLVTANCQLESFRGSDDPVLGWQSVGYLKMKPATVVRAICRSRDCAIHWSIDLDAQP